MAIFVTRRLEEWVNKYSTAELTREILEKRELWWVGVAHRYSMGPKKRESASLYDESKRLREHAWKNFSEREAGTLLSFFLFEYYIILRLLQFPGSRFPLTLNTYLRSQLTPFECLD